MKTGPHDRNEDFMTHEPPELQRVHGEERDREITLNMGTILGIFFALVLVCAVFFGMGYSLGRRSSLPQGNADGTPADSGSFNGFKPSPQSVAIQPVPASSTATSASNNAPVVSAPVATAEESAKPAATPVTESAPVEPVKTAAPAPTKPIAAAPIVSAPPAAAAGAQPSIVQVSAVSHQEDADLLVSSLRKRGYAVFARPDANDKLIHIQLGPFPSKAEANAMRQKLLADGYNAIVK